MSDGGISCELGGNGKRRCVEEDDTNDDDRLSHLPEFIVHHILSFLDTKAAVQTSVLSRAWRCAWKHVPILNLRSDSFEQYSSFERYVDNVLNLRDPSGGVRKISYIDNEDWEDLDCDLVGRVIKYGFAHDTQHLVIDLKDRTTLCCHSAFSDLFGTISSCNLGTLELKYVSIDDGFASAGFGMLTTLNLEFCEVEAGLGQAFDPFSSFPCLTNLVMVHCSHFRKISGPQLLRLTLHGLFSPWEEIEISAPRLRFLSLLPELEDMKFSKLSIPSLDHVDIRVTDMNDFLEENEECVRQRFITLFQYLNNATSLTLGPHTIRVLSSMSEYLDQQPSPFRRLKSLIMEAEDGVGVPYTLINFFLKGSSMKPNLEFV